MKKPTAFFAPTADAARFPNLQPITALRQSQTLRGLTDDVSTRRYFVDLRSLVDDKTVLKNPHKGWFWHYIDNGLGRGAYRDKHDPADDLADFPGLNHLYLRFDWVDVEKQPGVYDFSALDDIMAFWGPRGYTFSLRVCTFEGMTNPEIPFATPPYVFEEGARCFVLDDGSVQPDYGDPIFLRHLEDFMRAFGAKYNGDERIECVDIGTYGTWGEGHTVAGDDVIYSEEIVKKHLDLHCKYFPDTLLVCNDDHIAGRMANGQGEMQDMLEYADARGFGVQDDSICVDGYSNDCGYDTMRAPWAFDRLADNAPCVIEMAHYTYIMPEFKAYYRSGLTAIEAYKNAHATFAGFHGYPRDWLANERDVAEYCANRLGYWYFVTGVVIPPLTDTAHNRIRLDVENRGWARAWHRYTLRLALRGADGTLYPCDTDADNTLWMPGKPQTLNLRLDCRGVPAGEYDLCVGLFEKQRPILLALKEEIYADGWYTIGKTTIKRV